MRAFKLGEVLGCKTTSSKELVEYLRKIPVRELVEGVDKALTEEVTTMNYMHIFKIPSSKQLHHMTFR
jgi:hypothetical protein